MSSIDVDAGDLTSERSVYSLLAGDKLSRMENP